MSIEHARTDDKKPGLLDGCWRWPDEWAEAINKAPRTVQRWRRLGKGPPLTWMGNTAYVTPENGRAYIRANTESAA